MPKDEVLLTGLAGDWTTYCKTRLELKELLASMPKEQAAKRARAFAKKARASSSEHVRAAVFDFCLTAVLNAMPKKAPLPEDLEHFVILASPYEALAATILERVPLGRRLAIFERELARAEGYDAERITKRHLGLAPEATTAILDHFAKEKRLHQAMKWISEYQDVRIRELVRAYGKQHGIGKSPYTYVEPRIVRLADWSKLGAIGKAQWALAATAYCGRKVKDPASFVKALEKDDLDAGDGEMRHWKIMRGKTHAFDLWVVWVENGSFFEAASKKRVPVHIVQDTFEALAKDDATVTLASELAAAVPKSLWKVTRGKK